MTVKSEPQERMLQKSFLVAAAGVSNSTVKTS